MPASNIDLYHMQDARNNFDAMRPAPVCADANQYMGQCQNIHISTNCYYGYHDPKPAENEGTMTDCEMMETEVSHSNTAASSQINSRKRSADDGEQPHKKRFREDESPKSSLVGTRSSPSHSASAFNTNIPKNYVLRFNLKFYLIVNT
ncbi:unnamed protein product [Diatraea saccharalis]|uniref:Uncharacterized protein n=1 Tax=Diatraea saccharalis TaxID=40085 RepID=A0A9P0C6P0_9NEOP|nr:unnamed protein product [Diatraea saccharalis]